MQASTAILAVIDQINQILRQFSPAEYRQPLPEYNGSSIGQHFRHILEFFQCLENGVPDGIVDYAGRQRNLLYEDNPQLTAEAFSKFTAQLKDFELTAPLTVRAEFGSDSRPEYASTVGRELVFVYDHAIHHLAIIKIGLHCHFPHVKSDQDLGVSPSTIKFRNAANQ